MKSASRALATACIGLVCAVSQPISAEAQAPGDDLDLVGLLELKVVSASKEEESVDDAPSPVTVITDRMIAQSGAKSLKDLLTLYVPGITFVQDHNEVNVSIRGIYGSSQQKILILQDGHRLNNRAYSEANPDFSISLDKIKQIEVLRGPGSSLYGNVALTGVINLVTKRGSDLNGGTVSGRIGSFGERQASATFGFNTDDFDISMWGMVYTARGEEISIPENEDYSVHKTGHARAILGGFDDPPSYDVGMRLQRGQFSLFASARSSKYIEPFTAGGSPTGQSYTYDDFRTLEGMGPGLRSDFVHLGANYDAEITDNFTLSLNPYFDHSNIFVHLVLDPATQTSAAPRWNEYDYGSIIQGKLHYDWLGEGSLTVGTQVESMKLYDSQFPIQTSETDDNGNQTLPDWTTFGDSREKQLLDPGSEVTAAGFTQLRHNFSEEFLINVGGRYDFKDRHKGESISNFSPRLAMVYKLADAFSLKASCSGSFVDAPYWYRYNSLASYRGGEDLKPEHLTSYQLNPTVKFMDGRLRYSMNLFYNKLTDFIWRNNDAGDHEPIYQNAGFLDSYGSENELAYVHKYFEVRTNVTFQAALDAENYGVKGSEIYNIPSLTGNLILDLMPIPGFTREFHTNLSVRYLGAQTSPISGVETDASHTLDQVVLMDAGITVQNLLWEGWRLTGNVYNATDERWKQGGSVQHPYPQTGRWFSLTGALAF